jgi:AraC-like DNA-binding protein
MLVYLLISFSFVSLLFCLGELVTRNKKENNLLLAYIYFSGFYFFFHSYLMHSHLIHEWKFLFLTPTPLLAILGPVSQRYLFLTFEGYKESTKVFKLKFLPALLVFVLVIPFYFRNTSDDLVLNEIGNIHLQSIPLHVKLGVSISLGSLFYFYMTPLFSLLKTIPFQAIFQDRKLSIFFLISSCISFILPLLIFFTYFFNRAFMHVCISVYCGLMLCFFFLLKQRYPDFFLNLQEKVMYEKKYRKSQLTRVDLENFKTKFKYQFEIEKVFLDANLSLRKLAKKLGISTHQLSEYLNTVEQRQFYQILASYRVEEAKKKLKEGTQTNLLGIAYGSGFNSKSSFNQVFKQTTGFTPSEYKKNLSKSNGLDDT